MRVVASARPAACRVSTARQVARPLQRAPVRHRDVATVGAASADPAVVLVDEVDVPKIDKLSYSEQVRLDMAAEELRFLLHCASAGVERVFF